MLNIFFITLVKMNESFLEKPTMAVSDMLHFTRVYLLDFWKWYQVFTSNNFFTQ